MSEVGNTSRKILEHLLGVDYTHKSSDLKGKKSPENWQKIRHEQGAKSDSFFCRFAPIFLRISARIFHCM